MQPWTPCLPIKGGKLKTSKHYSASNPQLPFMSSSNLLGANSRNNSSNSLNSSCVWREVTPNNFNMYSASVSSLNSPHRYSLGPNTGSPEWRPISQEKAHRKLMHNLKNKLSFNSESLYSSNLFEPNKTKQNYNRFWANVSPTRKVEQKPPKPGRGNGIYDRRLNRSFETPPKELKSTPLRRSTPHLGIDNVQPDNISRHSVTWCCSNFVIKQWRKMHNYD